MRLLPFIENAFKYGSTENEEEPGIRIKIYIFDTPLPMAVVNPIKYDQQPAGQKQEIGIKNTKKRLRMI